jgi:hypothetical protein
MAGNSMAGNGGTSVNGSDVFKPAAEPEPGSGRGAEPGPPSASPPAGQVRPAAAAAAAAGASDAKPPAAKPPAAKPPAAKPPAAASAEAGEADRAPAEPADVTPWAGTMGTSSPLAAGHAGSGGGAGWLSDGSSTRRPSVVFEEDDDLDVPDFLK